MANARWNGNFIIGLKIIVVQLEKWRSSRMVFSLTFMFVFENPPVRRLDMAA